MAQRPGMEMIVPGTGEIVDLGDVLAAYLSGAVEEGTPAVAEAFNKVKALEELLAGARRDLADELVSESETWGGKTLHLEGGLTVVISGGREWQYDAVAIEEELRKEGMSEERIREIVVEQTTYSVNAAKAKQAAAANVAYRDVIERNRTEILRRPSVSVK